MATEKQIIANKKNALLAGRPKGSIAPARMYSIAVKDYIAKRIHDNLKPIVDAMLKEIYAGNVMSFIALRDTAFGKPPQGVYQSDDAGNPIVFMPVELIQKHALQVQQKKEDVKQLENGSVEPDNK